MIANVYLAPALRDPLTTFSTTPRAGGRLVHIPPPPNAGRLPLVVGIGERRMVSAVQDEACLASYLARSIGSASVSYAWDSSLNFTSACRGSSHCQSPASAQRTGQTCKQSHQRPRLLCRAILVRVPPAGEATVGRPNVRICAASLQSQDTIEVPYGMLFWP
eukprot:scaffold4412_cov401-Prasinococcus_capsulatus_cf.AAC.4